MVRRPDFRTTTNAFDREDAMDMRRRNFLWGSAVVIGGGYVGVEMAEAMVRRGLAVTLLEKSAQPMATVDPDMGERVTAFVQLADGQSATEAELVEWCRERLSHFKCPREVRFVEELPRLPTGKLLKRLLVT